MSDKKAFGEPVAAAADATKDIDVGEVVNQSQRVEDGQYQRTISSRQIHVGCYVVRYKRSLQLADRAPRSCP